MKTAQENIANIKSKIEEVKAHCLCVSFKQNSDCFFVTLPPGYRVDAVRARFGAGCSKLECLNRILTALERYWKESYVTGSFV